MLYKRLSSIVSRKCNIITDLINCVMSQPEPTVYFVHYSYQSKIGNYQLADILTIRCTHSFSIDQIITLMFFFNFLTTFLYAFIALVLGSYSDSLGISV